ncbi:MAG TPA: PQQ-dependent sugar dehydrogenase [Acidimicrobiia bacterium]|jgi:hypothetical protein
MRRPIVPVLVGVITLVGACSGDVPADTTVLSSRPTVVVTTAPPSTTSPPGSTSSSTVVPLPAPTTTVVATTTSLPPQPVSGDLVLTVEQVATGFDQPVFVTTAPGDERLFVLDQPGRIWLIDGGEPGEYLDIRDQVAFGGERGLLGLAFHPDHADNGRFYVHYSDRSGDTTVSEFTVEAGADAAAAATERVLLTAGQPASNHNGGMIGFGPDEYLWIGLGDGGGRDDRFRNAQDPHTLLGALLRIDVDGATGQDAEPYGIPPDNPYADGVDGAPEVWATGMRNPWRWSFDGTRLYVGDVGQNAREEIDVIDIAGVSGPLNFGWPNYEGAACYLGPCEEGQDFVEPSVEIGHDDGCSVIGGYVYRGAAIPELAGHYLYSDYCGGWVRSALIADDGSVVDAHEWIEPGRLSAVTSFGVDAAREVYLTTADGSIWRLVPG